MIEAPVIRLVVPLTRRGCSGLRALVLPSILVGLRLTLLFLGLLVLVGGLGRVLLTTFLFGLIFFFSIFLRDSTL